MPHDVTLVRRSESQVVLTGINEGDVVAMSNPDQQNKTGAGNRQQQRHEGAFQMILRFPISARQLANLRAQKTRTLLTALGIVFGVGLGDRDAGDRLGREGGVAAVHRAAGRAEHPDRFAAGHEPGGVPAAAAVFAGTDRSATSAFCKANIESVETLSPRKTLHPARVLPKPSRDMPELYGVRPSYSLIHSLRLAEGRFFDERGRRGERHGVRAGGSRQGQPAGLRPAVGKYVKVNDTWLQVVGVLHEQLMAGVAVERRRDAGHQQHRLRSAEHAPIPLLGPERLR